jgi:hypothetical protein
VVCPIEINVHHVVNIGPGVNLSVKFGPNLVLALLVCTYFRPSWAFLEVKP